MISPERFVFFSLRSFQTDVGETLRIYGIVNALASAGHEVVLLSNARQYNSFHPAVQHIFIKYPFKNKRLFQAVVSALPATLVWRLFQKLFRAVEQALLEAKAQNQPVFFFDYLDNSVAYVLQQTASVVGYINDVHGIATTEFQSNKEKSRNFFQRLLFDLKYRAADRLDRKVFEAACGFLFGSSAMQTYFEERYNIAHKKSLVLPYLLDSFSLNKPVDPVLQQEVASKLQIGEEDFIFMFVGSYKGTAGTEDLIAAFNRLYEEGTNCRLVMIGEGGNRTACEQQASALPAAGAITFLNPVPYTALPAYYALSAVIVCPDRDNPFSQYVVHIKYLDALATGKLVINGAFQSVLEINNPQPLSLLFKPSSQQSLYEALRDTYHKYEILKDKYKESSIWMKSRFTYVKYTDDLVSLNRSTLNK